jgi:ketosteroid isomerase-like protein
MNRALYATVFALIAATPKHAVAQAGPMATVQHFLEAFNKGDAKAAGAACADDAVIIDEFAPYEWKGGNGCAKWMDAYAADAAKNRITDPVVSLGTPIHEDVTGDHAYIVLPAVYKFNRDGKPVAENSSWLTLALQKGARGWLIVGWAWTKGA